MQNKIKIIYMGTPSFAVPSLLALTNDEMFDVSLVVTQPDKPKGRGKKIIYSPVKEQALKLNLNVFQPENVNDEQSLKRLSKIKPDFIVVAAFGQILSQKLLDIPKIMPINIHASLLPKYRGASPVQTAILNMERFTGITIMQIIKKLDAGDILLSCKIEISKDETAEDLLKILSLKAANFIVKSIKGLLDKTIIPLAQDHLQASYTKMFKKEDGKINWNLSGKQIIAHINAMTPWPCAFTKLGSQTFHIYKAELFERSDLRNSSYKPGTIFHCDKKGIHVAIGRKAIKETGKKADTKIDRNKSVIITELKVDSGKRMTVNSFLCGNKISLFSIFES